MSNDLEDENYMRGFKDGCAFAIKQRNAVEIRKQQEELDIVYGRARIAEDELKKIIKNDKN